ncbi:MAG: SpoIIE family protein phosphatase [Candidatus Latescibacteria bacterium]|nr:SpoIIE family protein phosphatase [Candidatus Latescibacterota bacterium]NIO01054.1 SpoIIE family protein phosphatase [Candidatus Latescibacterota bacterium]NIO27453.1 SpoIIE family protein phosphatase [Candidatus Latescibacterota bacterium]NIO54975.1 SpoIIE family protein phosphatase [Candidatus Latescibacterota bacterium]NIT01064.1 SpoIIE family protein phosphatase [Candidatus Latescibacterota bacterium]
MDKAKLTDIRTQLIDRRWRLERAIDESKEDTRLVSLLQEVDLALDRVANGTYGMCKTCNEPIEEDVLVADPLVCFCLDHLDAEQQRALEHDLKLASRIQAALLPENGLKKGEWRVHYHYEPAGLVSGDYCDLVAFEGDDGGLLFVVGDVSGKGVAASMLMSHLHAVFHSLAAFDLPVNQLVERASRLLCESTMSSHFATLVCGRAGNDGTVEISNAGHLPPLLFHGDEVIRLEATGLPAGVLCKAPYSVRKVSLDRGDRLVLYTDGLSEATSGDLEYGEERISQLALRHAGLSPEELVAAYVEDLNTFTSGSARQDDLTILVIQRAS